MFLLFCYVANHGKGLPGWAVDGAGQSLPLLELQDECGFESADDLTAFLAFAAERRLIDPVEWAERGIIVLPAMFARAQSYAHSKGRTLTGGPENAPAVRSGQVRGKSGKKTPAGARTSPELPLQDSTTQDKTVQVTEGPLPAEPAEPSDTSVDALVTLWNTERKPGPKVQKVTSQRRAAYRKALQAHPNLIDWAEVIRYVNGQGWCNGKGRDGHANYFMDLDKLAAPGYFARAMDKARLKPAAQGNGRDAARGRTGVDAGNPYMDAVADDVQH